MKKLLVMAALLLGACCASEAAAAGFRLPDQDAAALGTAGAFVGQADNPSSVWYNPAAITRLEGTQARAGAIAVYPVMRHENLNGTIDVGDRDVFLPAQIYITNRLNDRMSFGFGVNSPFGLSTYWSPLSSTSPVATLSRVKTVNLNPNLAYRMNDSLSVGIGIDYIRLDATLERLLPIAGVPSFRLNGEGTGIGANAAVLYRVNDQVDLGLSYRSRIGVKVDGPATIGSFAGAYAETQITLPDVLQIGTSVKASDDLLINLDLEYTWWSTYDRLEVRSPLTGITVEEKQWKNTWTARAGGQYRVSQDWKARGGLVYDKNPVPSERFETTLPDSDRAGVTIGTGYSRANWSMDISYMYLRFRTRHITNSYAGETFPIPLLNGTYKSQAHLLGLSVGYRF